MSKWGCLCEIMSKGVLSVLNVWVGYICVRLYPSEIWSERLCRVGFVCMRLWQWGFVYIEGFVSVGFCLCEIISQWDIVRDYIQGFCLREIMSMWNLICEIMSEWDYVWDYTRVGFCLDEILSIGSVCVKLCQGDFFTVGFCPFCPFISIYFGSLYGNSSPTSTFISCIQISIVIT